MILFFRWLVVLAVSLSAAAAQNAPTPQLQPRPPEPPTQPSSSPDRQITLYVQMREKPGTPVPGLQKQDFTILDDKQPKNIVSFQAVDGSASAAADPPVEVVLVVDAVNTGFQAVTFERTELKK